MNNEEKHFDEDLELRVSDKLSADLNNLYKTNMTIPPEVDRAIMDRAYQKIIHRHKKHRIFRWSACAAAAVAVIFMLTLYIIRKPHPSAIRSDIVAAKTDIDRSGSVDILDAFQLARHIKSTDPPNMKWDINGDGFVDHQDVDSIAFAAVRLDKGIL
ncbi:MAG: dockerin type I domain-containing protein [Candidatus Thorarchaeota archaeon]